MRTNKWSATVALVTLLLTGHATPDPGQTRATAAKPIIDEREPQGCDCDDQGDGPN